MELDPPIYAVQRLPNGYWLVRAPTGDPVGPRLDNRSAIRLWRSARRVRDENAQRQIGDDTRAQALLDADMALLVVR
jgi:hypothetical protein